MNIVANTAFFVSDLHGHVERFNKLFRAIETERPRCVFIGGDILPGGAGVNVAATQCQDFIADFLVANLHQLKQSLREAYPPIFLILGNDDGRYCEAAILNAAANQIWHYIHFRRLQWQNWAIYGYAYIPPTPFGLKDWERFDVSRYLDPGCTAPDTGYRSVAVSEYESKYATIAEDLQQLTAGEDLHNAVFLFHAPPYNSPLDRAALDGAMIDHVPLDVHIGSIAIDRFIKTRQPLLTLHGHVHESARITGEWQIKIGRTYAFNAAHDGPELALIRIDLDHPENSRRELISGS